MRKKIFVTFATIVLILGVIFEFSGIQNLPDTINITYGQSKSLKFNLPISLKPDSTDVLHVEKDDNQNIEIIPNEPVDTELSVNVFGIPVKNVKVSVHSPMDVVPGGQSIGVALYTKGALVVGTSNIKDENGNIVNPAKEAGLRSGDVIEKVNDIEVKDADHVMDIVNSANTVTTKIDINREGQKQSILVEPVKDANDGSYRLGIWVRDSMAGVGTLSFYNPTTLKYASLGHAIYDNETRTLLNLKTGEVVESDIFGIKAGEIGTPGELKGSFDSSKKKLGNIAKNNDFGIYGQFYRKPNNHYYSNSMKTALIEEIKVGPAKILSTIDGEGIKEYDVYIEKLARQEVPSTKSMVIRVTDKELIEKTGGIIQGMSGSPIIQDDKIIGAVTHVFVNDPTRGYGLYAQWMLDEMK